MERGENAVRIVARSLRRLGSVDLLRPVPVRMAVSNPSFSCAHGASCSYRYWAVSAKAVNTITLRFPVLIGFFTFFSISCRKAANLASRPALTCRAAESRVARRLRSSVRSCRQRTKSTSCSNTCTFRPTKRLSNAGSSTSTSSMSISSILLSWASSLASVAFTSLSCRSRVSEKDETALSIRLRTLTRSR